MKTETERTANVPFLLDITIRRDYIENAEEAKPIADACGHPYKFAIANPVLYQELNQS